jgi:hypothetical protein
MFISSSSIPSGGCLGHMRPQRLPVAACYFKFEPGTEGDIYKPWVAESWHQEFIRQKVKLYRLF